MLTKQTNLKTKVKWCFYIPVPPVPPAVSSQLTIKTQTTEVRMNANKEGLSGWLQNGISLHSLQLYWGFLRAVLQVTIKSLWKLLLKTDFQAGLKHLNDSDYTKSPICTTLLELLQLLMQVLMLLLLCLLVNKTRWLMLESLCWVFNPLSAFFYFKDWQVKEKQMQSTRWRYDSKANV